ncbi:MAG: DUF4177 domain-containing protein [Truepera sp.]|nr:DUF4177 domain-containing protein [Truepera sp.]
MQRFEYDYVRIEPQRGGDSRFDRYRDVVTQRAAEGWRFVTAIVPPEIMTSSGRAYLDLVFERPLN